jgi:hypothetical protein
MQPVDWFVFVASGVPKHVSVTRIGSDLCQSIGCSSDLVKMDHHYALKSTHKHRFQPDHFQVLTETIARGRVIADRQKHLTFFYLDRVMFGHWFQATIKRNERATELWVATFHQASEKEVLRMTKKYGVLRPEK